MKESAFKLAKQPEIGNYNSFMCSNNFLIKPRIFLSAEATFTQRKLKAYFSGFSLYF